MRVLVVGAGGVGSAVAAVAERHDSFERIVLADLDLRRAERAIAALDGVVTTETFLYLDMVKQLYDWGTHVNGAGQ